ncbi:methyltransferase [Colletotrichum higginsianum]|nr:methyltransferase [Colletotrichum higginsianum]
MANSVPYLVPVLDSLPPNFTLLDVGCALPSATILAIDGSPAVISQARDAAQKANVQNVRFAVGDALDLGPTASEPGFELIKGACDVAHTHNVVMHTSDAPRALVELRSAVKVGGFVCCKEADRACLMLWPENQAIRRTYEVISAIMDAKGCDPYVGRKLKTYAMAAGFSSNDITVGQAPWVVSSREERENWGGLVARTSADAEARASIESEARCIGLEINLEELQKGWRDWIDDDTACASISDIYVVCRNH